MTYSFSAQSQLNLEGCDPDLQKVFNKVIEEVDCSVISGHRGEAEQNLLHHQGRSQLKYPKSKHNHTPSLAIDVVPYPVDWKSRDRFYLFAGYVLATAKSMGVELRWGGDWDGDFEIADNSFDDLAHFEKVTNNDNKKTRKPSNSSYPVCESSSPRNYQY